MANIAARAPGLYVVDLLREKEAASFMLQAASTFFLQNPFFYFMAGL
jgi:hypothetical protein